MSDDSQNPYAAQRPLYATAQPNRDQQRPGLGYVRQIPILAIITIVQGALLSLMALLLAGYGVFFGFFFQEMMPEAERARMQAESGPVFEVMTVVLIGAGVFFFVLTVMHIIAGIRVLQYRGRGFIILTWFLGLLASLTFYCAPTSVGLAIWGLVVFFNPAVKSAFKMVEDGMDKREVERQFY